MIMYHDKTCSAKSNVSNLFYDKRRIVCLMTVFIHIYCVYVCHGHAPKQIVFKNFIVIVVCSDSGSRVNERTAETELTVGTKKLLD